MSATPTLHVATTSGYRSGVGTVYFGLLRQDSLTGHEAWRCGHEHPARPGARACACGELHQRRMAQRDQRTT